MSMVIYDDPFLSAGPMIYTSPIAVEEVLLPLPMYEAFEAPVVPVLEVPFMPRPVIYSPALESIDPLLLGW